MAKKATSRVVQTPASLEVLRGRLETRDSNLQDTYTKILKAVGIEIEANYNIAYFKEKKEREKQWWEKRTDNGQDMTVEINLLHQIIEAQRTILGATRSLRVPLKEPGDVAQKYSDKLEFGIRHLWREWTMPRRFSLAGWYAAVLGSAVATLHWSRERKIPVLNIHSPQSFYAEVSLDDDTELNTAMFVTQTTGSVIAAEYPEFAEEWGDVDEITLIDYYDRYQRMRSIVGEEQPLIDEPNSLGRVPVFIIPGLLGPGHMGLAVMMLAVPIYNELQRLYSLEAEQLVDQVRAPTVINDPISVPENFKWGDDAVIEVGPQGKVGKAVVSTIDWQVFFHRIEDMKRSLDNVMDFAAMSRGNYEGSNLSGKGVQNILAPNSLRLEGRMQSIDPVYEKINEVALLMWKKKGGRIGTINAWGNKGNEEFVVPFDPAADIDPLWVRNHVWLDSSSMFDRQSSIVNVLQALRSGTPAQQAISQRRAVELLPFSDDTLGEVNQIWSEAQQAQQFAMQAAGPAGPPQGGPSQEETASAMEKGGNDEGAKAAPNAGGQKGEAAAPSGAEVPQPGVPQTGENILALVAEHFRGIKNIHGTVYICGAVLQNRLDLGIEIFLSDTTDKQTIVNSFTNDELLKEIPGNNDLHFRTDPPSGPVLDVTPGTTGLEPETLEGVKQSKDSPTPEQLAQGSGAPNIPAELTGQPAGPFGQG